MFWLFHKWSTSLVSYFYNFTNNELNSTRISNLFATYTVHVFFIMVFYFLYHSIFSSSYISYKTKLLFSCPIMLFRRSRFIHFPIQKYPNRKIQKLFSSRSDLNGYRLLRSERPDHPCSTLHGGLFLEELTEFNHVQLSLREVYFSCSRIPGQITYSHFYRWIRLTLQDL